MTAKFKNFTVSALVLVLTFSLSFNSYSQEGRSAINVSGGVGYSMLGTGMLNLNNLNSMLESNGYPALTENFFMVGGGGHSVINRLIIGGEGYSLLGDDVVYNDLKQSVYASCGFFDIGYIALSYKGLNMYPLLGIGGGEMRYSIKEDISSISFAAILDDPQRSVELKTGGFLLNLGGGIDYILGFGKDNPFRGGFLLGIRAGYILTPFRGDWMMDEIEISGSPKTGIKGPYISIIIGGGVLVSTNR